MQIDSIYRRSLVQTIAGKAIRDLRRGGERELRNVAQLCRGPASPPGYQRFWSMLEEVLRLPGQQYGALLSRAARDVDLDCLKTLIANLGLHAYASGSETLRQSWAFGCGATYWLEPLDWTADLRQLHQAICALQQQGASSFFFSAQTEAQLDTALRIAAQHRQCVFLLLCPACVCAPARLEELTALGNLIPMVRWTDLSSLAGPLRQAGALFGFHRSYSEIQSPEEEEGFLSRCIQAGCFFGVYEGGRPCCQDERELFYYSWLQALRRQGRLEILLGDLWRDREEIQRLLLHKQSFPNCFQSVKSASDTGRERL